MKRWLALAAALMGCAKGAVSAVPVDSDTGEPQPDGTSAIDGAIDSPLMAIDAAPEPDAAPFMVPALTGSTELCKLISNRNSSDPTPNDLHHTANILGADLGVPVVSNDRLYLLFGDTVGRTGIWPVSESHPDFVGYGLDSATAIAANPSLLCSRMAAIRLPVAQSYGPTLDSSILADFAGAAMIAPSGHQLNEYIRYPAGNQAQGGVTFPQLPGDFEVPSGAFAYGSAIYVFYTTVVSPSNIEMIGSYLAKWESPTTTGPFAYNIQYALDNRLDPSSPLGGNYVHVAAETYGNYVYLFGTGKYRKSGIHVARKLLTTLTTAGGVEERGEIIAPQGYGEISVKYFPSIHKWMLLAQEELPTSNRIVAYFAPEPEGPWSAPIVVHDMADTTFRSTYCCATENNCNGAQFMNCNRTAFYATYLFPTIQETATTFTVTYTMSSFSPYNVALFQTEFAK